MKKVAYEESIISFTELYRACNRNHWFTHGDVEQYDRMFDANRDGLPLDQLAAMIYICSDAGATTLDDIAAELVRLQTDSYIPEF